MRWQALAAVAAAALTVGCGPRAPSPCEVAPAGYAALERGDLSAAEALADRGAGCRDAVAAWSVRVLKAEILMKRRRAQEALDLLADPPPAGGGQVASVRALMTRGYARCYLARSAKDARVGEADFATAESLAGSSGPSASELLGDIWLRRGTCVSFHESGYDEAEALFRKALRLGAEARLPRVESDAAGALGNLRLLASRYDDGAEWLQRSRTLLRQLDPRTVDVKVLTNLGWCYTTLGDTDRAVPLLKEAHAQALRYGYGEEAYLTLAHLGTCFLRRGEPAAAREHYERAVPIARDLGFEDDVHELLELLQTVALRGGDRPAAQRYAEQAAQLSPNAKGRAGVSLVEGELAAARGDVASAESIYRRLAEETQSADVRWRAHAALARLYVAGRRFADAEDAFRQARAAIERMRTELRQDTFDFLLYSSLAEFHGRYAAFLVDRGRAAEALAVVEQARGRVLWERLSPAAAPPAVPRLEAVARARHAVLLAYWTGERSFVWVVTGRSTRAHELPNETELRARVAAYQEALLQSDDLVARDGAGSLYETLVGPVADQIPPGARVIVAPDGPLHALAFDALVVPRPAPHYWLEDVVSMRAPALAPLAGSARRPGRAERALLLVGDPLPSGEAFPALPNAAPELAAVQSHFPAASSVVLTRAQATPAAYRAAQPERFGVIHFAAHATSNRDQPLESAVVLSPDGFEHKLYARDVLARPLAADLVTVSACEGAGARAYGGEGLVGFAWAFLRAGARHVVAGLWEVEDASTAQLMDRFYRGRADGLDEAAALREAKLQLLRSAGARRKPYYWGPFVAYVQ
ncbi:MAG: CHAT domain-containing protein [Vicinamibacteria bacterium]